MVDLGRNRSAWNSGPAVARPERLEEQSPGGWEQGCDRGTLPFDSEGCRMARSGHVRREWSRLHVGGVPLDGLGLAAAADQVVARASTGLSTEVHLCNAWTLALASDDAGLRRSLLGADLNLMDGMPLVWLARRHGLRIDDRAYGPDLMLRVMDLGREHGLRHYLYGSTPEVVDRLAIRLLERFPSLDLAGRESPPFRELEAEELDAAVTRVRQSEADVVWVGLGTPRQDLWAASVRGELNAVVVPVGAAFDFLAGTKPQAPTWMRKSGLEWLFRLASEPRRLWRRYLIGNGRFLWGLRRGTHVEPAPSTR